MKSFVPLYFLSACIACNTANAPSAETIQAIDLKKGNAILCGPSEGGYGLVSFPVTVADEAKNDFNMGVAMLHSFEYDEAEKAFSRVISRDPSCAMAYWGVAMSNYHPLWEPPTEAELKKGAKALEIAKSIETKSASEAAYIEAIGQFYNNWDKVDHKTRSRNYAQAMSRIYDANPSDKEAAILYSLALTATAEPTDKSYNNQKRAGEILNKIYTEQPEHPGIVHYIIHNYDNPALAETALPAARKYASIAPASAHAQHMPSHIFIRLGLWNEAIKSNIASISSAKCYAESARMNGTWDEELHGMDYLTYAYLQTGDNASAKRQWDNLRAIKNTSAQNAKVAYAYAAIPARYVLENRHWQDAANLEFYPSDFPWSKFPWQKAITHFARLMGKVHTNDVAGAEKELQEMTKLRDALLSNKDQYKANQVEVQLISGQAWIELKKGNADKATQLMQQAADLEDKTEKHPVTPGEVLPAKELLADMWLALNKPAKALETYEADMQKHPGRFNGLYGAGSAAEKAGNVDKAVMYYTRLNGLGTQAQRPELGTVREYLKASARR